MSQEKFDAPESWRGNDLFSEKESAALEYAETMTFTDRESNDGSFAWLKSHFDEETIVELTGLIAFQNLSRKFNSALDIPPPGFCALGKERTTQNIGRKILMTDGTKAVT